MKTLLPVLCACTLMVAGCSYSVTKNGQTKMYQLSNSGGYSESLSVRQLQQVVNDRVIHNHNEAFYFLPEHKMVYEIKTSGEKKKSAWFIKTSNVPHRNNKEYAVLCLAIGVTSTKEFRYSPCYRFFREKDNHYMGQVAMCHLEHSDEIANVSCHWADRKVGWYTFTPKEQFNTK